MRSLRALVRIGNFPFSPLFLGGHVVNRELEQPMSGWSSLCGSHEGEVRWGRSADCRRHAWRSAAGVSSHMSVLRREPQLQERETQKEANNAPTRGQSTRLQPWMRETLRSTLSMGVGPQGGGNIFLLRPLLRLRRWMHLVTPSKPTLVLRAADCGLRTENIFVCWCCACSDRVAGVGVWVCLCRPNPFSLGRMQHVSHVKPK